MDIENIKDLQIDFSPLNEWLESIGIADVGITGEIIEATDTEKAHIKIESRELKDDIGIMNTSFSSVKIQHISGEYHVINNYFWVRLAWRCKIGKRKPTDIAIGSVYYHVDTGIWDFIWDKQ